MRTGMLVAAETGNQLNWTSPRERVISSLLGNQNIRGVTSAAAVRALEALDRQALFTRLDDTVVLRWDWEHVPAARLVLLVEKSTAGGCVGGKQQPTRSLTSKIDEMETVPFGTRTHCCCDIVDEKGKARNKLPGGIRCDERPDTKRCLASSNRHGQRAICSLATRGPTLPAMCDCRCHGADTAGAAGHGMQMRPTPTQAVDTRRAR